MPKMIFLCVSKEAIAICPCCGHPLAYRDCFLQVLFEESCISILEKVAEAF